MGDPWTDPVTGMTYYGNRADQYRTQGGAPQGQAYADMLNQTNTDAYNNSVAKAGQYFNPVMGDLPTPNAVPGSYADAHNSWLAQTQQGLAAGANSLGMDPYARYATNPGPAPQLYTAPPPPTGLTNWPPPGAPSPTAPAAPATGPSATTSAPVSTTPTTPTTSPPTAPTAPAPSPLDSANYRQAWSDFGPARAPVYAPNAAAGWTPPAPTSATPSPTFYGGVGVHNPLVGAITGGS